MKDLKKAQHILQLAKQQANLLSEMLEMDVTEEVIEFLTKKQEINEEVIEEQKHIINRIKIKENAK